MDVIEAKTAAQRKQGLEELTDCIEREQRVRASLTANSRKTGEGHCAVL
jgi:hypothetical protein